MELRQVLATCARLALVVTAFGVGGAPGPATAAHPPGQATTNVVSVDCDRFEDGQHEVPILIVTTPLAGNTLPAGALTIQGAALDCHADVGVGINRVSVFLGRRDAGGLHLGDAVLRRPNPIQVSPADQYATVGWTLDTSAPLKPGQVNELYVYARSEVNNAETMVAVSIVGSGAAGAASPAPTPTAAASVAPGAADSARRGGEAPNIPANNIPLDLPGLPPEPEDDAPGGPAIESPAAEP